MSAPLNKYSSKITQPETQGSSQAMLYATGMSEADMNKAQVGIASMWFDGNPCNMHLLDLAAEVKKGVAAAGLLGMRFNTIGVSDGISMGTDGMSYSLQSRDLIADSIETVMCAQWYDACIVHPRLRQEHARLADGARPAESARLHDLRRHDPRRRVVQGREDRHRLGLHVLRRQMMGRMTDAERRDVVRRACPGEALAAACTRPTRWPRRSKRWA